MGLALPINRTFFSQYYQNEYFITPAHNIPPMGWFGDFVKRIREARNEAIIAQGRIIAGESIVDVMEDSSKRAFGK